MTAKSKPISLTSKTGRRIILPTAQEDDAINAGIASDADTVELTEEWFAKAKRGGRPLSDNPKQLRSIRFSPEVLDYFRSTGKGWQTRVDAALKEWIAAQK
jgi:uncharacterized protein (DUF4415 family)